MTQFRNVTSAPIDLESGAVFGPGEFFTLTKEQQGSEHNKRYIESGSALEITKDNSTDPKKLSQVEAADNNDDKEGST